MTLTDERIRYLVDYIYREFQTDNVDVDERAFDDIHDALDELLQRRKESAEKDEQIREWREDSERLAEYCPPRGTDGRITHSDKVLDAHNALLERYKA